MSQKKKRSRTTRLTAERRLPPPPATPPPPTPHRGLPLTIDTPLSAREEVFSDRAALHHNLARAARECGCSHLNAGKQGLEMARRPNVAAAIERKRDARADDDDRDWKLIFNLLKFDAKDGELKIRDRHRAAHMVGVYMGKGGDPIDTRPYVSAFTLPPETPGVSIH